MKNPTLHYSSFYLLIDYIAAVKDLGLALLQPWTNTGRWAGTRFQAAGCPDQSQFTASSFFLNSIEPAQTENEIWLPQVWMNEFGNDGYLDDYPDEIC